MPSALKVDRPSQITLYFDRNYTLMRNEEVSYAMHDPNVTTPSCKGYYWGLLQSFCVDLIIRYAAAHLQPFQTD